MRRLLLTGGAGFIGHHTITHLLERTDWQVVVLDGLTYAGDARRVAEAIPDTVDRARVELVWHDLRAPLVGSAAAERIGAADYVINMASDSHVERSMLDPVPFVRNNVDIALSVLEWCREVKPLKVIQVSTDEVYGPAPEGHAHVEWETVAPSNPYAASKACQEAIAYSYWRTFGVPLAITNTMNNYGERQHREKFLPMAVRRLLAGTPVPVHGRPLRPGVRRTVGPRWRASSRVWMHARNHADALRFLLEQVPFPRYEGNVDDGRLRPLRLNVAGEAELGVDQVVRLTAEALGLPWHEDMLDWVDYHSSRPGHDMRYSLDGTALAGLGWVAPVPLKESLARTVQWFARHPEWL